MKRLEDAIMIGKVTMRMNQEIDERDRNENSGYGKKRRGSE